MDDRDDLAQPSQYASHQPEPITPEQDEIRQQKDPSQYSLTVEDASHLFYQAGVPRSVRTVIRYCTNNTLDCIKVDTERNLKYLVSQESVNARITELQQITDFRHNASRLDMTRHDAPTDEPRHDTTSHNATGDENKKIEVLNSRVGELEREKEELIVKNRDLEITNRVKDALLTRNESMLGTARSQLMKFNRAVGELATILRLKAPEADTSQIIAYLDAPTQATDPEHENFVDV